MKNSTDPMQNILFKKPVLIILLVLGYISSFAQIPEIEMEKCFGGDDTEYTYDMLLSGDTTYIVLGTSASTNGDVHGNHGDRDVWLLKLNTDLDTLWTKCYGGSEQEWTQSIIETNDNGYLICAETFSFDGDIYLNHGVSDAWLLKLNTNGDTLWTKCYGGTLGDAGVEAIQVEDEGYLVCSGTESNDGDVHGNHGSWDVWLMKINSAGDTLWTKCFGGSKSDFPRVMVKTNDENYAIAGYTSSDDFYFHGNHGGSDFFIMKINETGDTLWTKCYGGSLNEGIYDVGVTQDNGFIVTGYTLSDDGDVHGYHADYDGWVMKLDDSGNIEWETCIGGSLSDYTVSVLQTDDNNYLFAGYAESNDGDVHGNHGERDCWMIMFNAIGDTIWSQCYGGSNVDQIKDVKSIDNGYIICGYTRSDDGDVLSEHHLESDYWIIKLTIPEQPEALTTETGSYNLYPNPADNRLYIDGNDIRDIQIFDLNGNLLIQTSEKEIDLKRFSPGIYIISMTEMNGVTITTKLTISK